MKHFLQTGIAKTQLLMGLAVVGAAVVVIASFIFNRPSGTQYRQTADSFMSALANNEPTKTYDMFTDKLKQRVSKSDWEKQVASSFADYKGKPKFVTSQFQQDPYEVYPVESTPIRLQYEFDINDKKYLMTIVLIKTGDIWKVNEWETHLQ